MERRDACRPDASHDVGASTYEPIVRTTRPLTSDPVGGDVEDARTRGLDNDDSKVSAYLNCFTPAVQRRLDGQRESRRACTGKLARSSIRKYLRQPLRRPSLAVFAAMSERVTWFSFSDSLRHLQVSFSG